MTLDDWHSTYISCDERGGESIRYSSMHTYQSINIQITYLPNTNLSSTHVQTTTITITLYSVPYNIVQITTTASNTAMTKTLSFKLSTDISITSVRRALSRFMKMKRDESKLLLVHMWFAIAAVK